MNEMFDIPFEPLIGVKSFKFGILVDQVVLTKTVGSKLGDDVVGCMVVGV